MKIAVVGSGISGLGAAYILSEAGHEVHLYEASERLGGHAHTAMVPSSQGAIPMDTGFLVYNNLTYPHLLSFFRHLGVETAESDMSLAIRSTYKNMEWAGTNLNSVFGQRINLLRPSFYRMLFAILRFHREVSRHLEEARLHAWTIGDFLQAKKYPQVFRDDYLLPMAAAIWSTPTRGMLAFPAETFLTFLLNHKLVQVNDRPIWRTVRNGSISYVRAVEKKLKHIHRQAPVTRIERSNGQVHIESPRGLESFDKVVLATHSPTALAMLSDASPRERDILSDIQVEKNTAVLHQNERWMPKNKICWASWNVLGTSSESPEQISLTYHLNRLQPLATQVNYFLTLNPPEKLAESIGVYQYDHPRFDQAAIRAQQELPQIQGNGGVYFAGAWTRYGFHEDGLLSAVRVAELLGAPIPWQAELSEHQAINSSTHLNAGPKSL